MNTFLAHGRRVFALLARALAVAAAVVVLPVLAQTDPPTRVGTLTAAEGSVAYAPQGETEWTEAALNRPITSGDRLWTDEGARAEVHLGSAAMDMDSRTFLDIVALDAAVMQATLNEGHVNARVRQLLENESFEIDTPNLAFQAGGAGNYRIDVDPSRDYTRITVRSGVALVYGANGASRELRAGDQLAFAGRDLLLTAVAAPVDDAFDQWSLARGQAEDQSVAARYVPRSVVGYQELDRAGSWVVDATYGPIWYPRITIVDWAPYRYGHWEWIPPWGWTWIDDARWGFAPFHYGRWIHNGSRWAWVPGRLGPRPVYAPALVGFIGGSGWSLSISGGPGVGWYPLAPWEVWQPYYRTSPVYVREVNRYVVARNTAAPHYFQTRPDAVTAIRVEDFHRGRPVHESWKHVSAQDLSRAQLIAAPPVPENRRVLNEARLARPLQSQPRVQQFAPPVAANRPPQGAIQQPPQTFGPAARPFVQQAVPGREQERVQREQQGAVQEQQRAAREQKVQQQRALQEQQKIQREQQVQQQRAAQEQQRAAREQQVQQQRAQHEQAVQQAQQAQAQRAAAQQAAQAQRQAGPPPQPQQQPRAEPRAEQRQQRQEERGGGKGGEEEGRGRRP